MEAEPVHDLPRGKGWLYEPKYDGFRCLAFRDGDKVDLQSKKQRSLPEVTPALCRRGKGGPFITTSHRTDGVSVRFTSTAQPFAAAVRRA